MKNFILLSGTSNPALAQSIAQELNVGLGKIEITRFIDNECRVRAEEDVAGKIVFVIQSLSQIADQHLMETCLIGQALRDLGANQTVVVMPWMGYCKQDKAFRKGEAVSAQLVAKFLESAGFTRMITVELHSEALIPMFNIPVTELSTHELLAKSLASAAHPSSMLVASPDKGGKSRSERFAKSVGLAILYLEKERDLETGKVTVKSISDDVFNRDVIIFDDIINTGATAIETINFLKQHGAKRVFFLATHAVLAGDAQEKLAASSIDRIIVTDTIAIPKEKRFAKLEIVSVAPLLAQAISAMIG